MDYVLDLDFAVFPMSSVVISLGILLCVVITAALYARRREGITAALMLSLLSIVFGVVFSRFLHWYFNGEAYASLRAAFTDFDRGSYCLQGMFLGIWLAAFLVKAMRLTRNVPALLDAAAPGVCLLVAFIRLSALFNTTCRSRILVHTRWLQFLPFASGLSDTAGNVTYRMATFFISFLLMLAVTVVVLRFYLEKSGRRMKRGCPRTGNTARLFVLLYAAVEIVMDSTRYDSPLMHFRILSDLNQFSAFISLAQIFAGFTALGILIYFTRWSIRCNGFRWYHIPVWLGFFVCLFVIGKLGEYNVQRYAAYLRCYAWMSAGCIAMVALIWSLYRSCVNPRELD